MTDDRKLKAIALKEAVKFMKTKIKQGVMYGKDDVIPIAKTFYNFLNN